jgi:hypothetical protein
MFRSLLTRATLLAIVTSFWIVPIVFAQNLGIDMAGRAAGQAGYSDVTETSFAETLGSVVKGALSFVGVIFLILMIYAGYLWMTARGDEGQVDKATDMIRTAIIGFIITMGAYSITAFVVPLILSRTTSLN